MTQCFKALRLAQLTGSLFIGYPVLASADDHVVVDALLVCQEHGVVVFDLAGGPEDVPQLAQRQDDLVNALHQKLMASRALRDGRQRLAVGINAVSVLPGTVPSGPLRRWLPRSTR